MPVIGLPAFGINGYNVQFESGFGFANRDSTAKVTTTATGFVASLAPGGALVLNGTAPAPIVELLTITALADAAVTLTAAQHRGEIVTVAAGLNDRIITTLTAALLLAAFPGAQVGSVVNLCMSNLKAANIVTVGLGLGVTGSVGFNAVVAAQTSATFKIVFTNVTASTEAATIVRVAG